MKTSSLKKVHDLINKDDYISAYLECTYILMLLPEDEDTLQLSRFIVNRVDEAYKDIPPETANDFLARGLVHLTRERLNEAMEDFEMVVQLDPNIHYTYKLRSYYHIAQLRPDLAIKEMLIATNVFEKGEYFDDLANLYFAVGEIKNALKCHLKAIELEPDNPRLWYNLGVFYADTQDVRGASIMFQQAIKLWPEYDDAIVNLNHIKTNFSDLL